MGNQNDISNGDAARCSRSLTGSRCDCGDDSTGWVEIKCCNICGRPHEDEPLDWRFDKMKDHEIAQLVNLIKAEVEPICSNQSLRVRISRVVTNYFHDNSVVSLSRDD